MRRFHGSSLIGDVRHLVEKPGVDVARCMNARNVDLTPQTLANLEEAIRGGDRYAGQQLIVRPLRIFGLGRVRVKTKSTSLERTQRLLQAFGECSTDGHRLTYRLHLGAQHAGGARKLLKGPTWDLGHHIINRWFE